MKRPVSVVLPSLDLPELLDANLPVLLAELDRRGLDDEVVVVDDTGSGAIVEHLATRFPSVVAVRQSENSGFARALSAGIEAARHDHIFSMNTDVRVHAGFLEPLLETLSRADVGLVAPRVRLGGEADDIESINAIRFERGLVSFRQPNLPASREESVELGDAPIDVAFAVGGTMLLERELFQRLGGFDASFEPFYWEDIDLSWRVWRAGLRVVVEPRSVVDHLHRGTIGKVVPRELVQCMLEKNRWLFTWKHLDRTALEEHLAGLCRLVIDATARGRRDELVPLCYALEQLAGVLTARDGSLDAPNNFRELAERTDPTAHPDSNSQRTRSN
ncbi:MAG: glycosyltransferase [Planctomycetota bacterium]